MTFRPGRSSCALPVLRLSAPFGNGKREDAAPLRALARVMLSGCLPGL